MPLALLIFYCTWQHVIENRARARVCARARFTSIYDHLQKKGYRFQTSFRYTTVLAAITARALNDITC